MLHIFGKLSIRATIFLSTPSQSKVCKKLWASKLTKKFVSRFWGYLTWESQEKLYFGADPMANHRSYYKRESGGFLKSGPW
jgi:hypothetical protein